MPNPPKGDEGPAIKTSFSLTPELGRVLDFYGRALRIRSRSRVVDWAIQTVDHILGKMDQGEARSILAAAAEPQGTSVAESLLRLVELDSGGASIRKASLRSRTDGR
jgi:hypothetical protein